MELFVIAMVMSIGTIVQAATYQQHDLTPVSFFVVDMNDDGGVELMVSGSSSAVQYSTDQISWFSLSVGEPIFEMEPLGRQRVYLRHEDDYTADLQFEDLDSGDLWNSVIIYWDGMGPPTNGALSTTNPHALRAQQSMKHLQN